MEQQVQRFYLFNCDNTYNLDSVEDLFLETSEKFIFKFTIVKKYFALNQMTQMSSIAIPELQMDYAVFVVHANESRLSINEEHAGIGYAKIYRALLRATGDKVLIVIGGDENYKDDDEKEKVVISRWALRKISSQFNEDFLDGRKGFIFSWDLRHRPIHEEALQHYFDSQKTGLKFVPQSQFKTLSQSYTPPVNSGSSEEFNVEDENTALLDKDKTTESFHTVNPPDADGAPPQSADEHPVNRVSNYPEGMVTLETRMRCGKISYEERDVVVWDGEWLPPEDLVQDLERQWKSTPEALLQMISDGAGRIQTCRVVNLTPLWRRAIVWLADGILRLWGYFRGNATD